MIAAITANASSAPPADQLGQAEDKLSGDAADHPEKPRYSIGTATLG
jgi:hypothetical protein